LDLQPSLEVSRIGVFDAHLFFSLALMLVAGILGGIANAYLAERQYGRHEDRRRHVILGIVTALTAPLLLNMLSSNLLSAARNSPGEFFVFAAFCLIYVVAIRRLFENPASFYQEEQERLRDEIRQELDELRAAHENLSAQLENLQQSGAPFNGEGWQESREALTYNDVDILRALADESYVYGNLAALTEKTGLGRELLNQRLAVLKGMGLIDTRISDKNMLHWVVSNRGLHVLSEILAGQDETP
jgi:DNA-binding transcriptional ArsR family regulator